MNFIFTNRVENYRRYTMSERDDLLDGAVAVLDQIHKVLKSIEKDIKKLLPKDLDTDDIV